MNKQDIKRGETYYDLDDDCSAMEKWYCYYHKGDIVRFVDENGTTDRDIYGTSGLPIERIFTTKAEVYRHFIEGISDEIEGFEKAKRSYEEKLKECEDE